MLAVLFFRFPFRPPPLKTARQIIREGDAGGIRPSAAGQWAHFPSVATALFVQLYATSLIDRAASLALHLVRLWAMQASVRMA